MAVSQVSGSNEYYLPKNQTKELTQTLDKDAFLKIMIAQLQYQDPTNPSDSNQFIQQMATFTTLEQITNLNTNMEKLYTLQQFSSASALIGRKVTVYNGQEFLTGTVDKVSMSESNAYLWVGGKSYILEQVISVEGKADDGSEKLQTGDSTTGESTTGEEIGTDETTDQ